VALAAPAGAWQALRTVRGPLTAPRRSGQVDSQAPQRYRVSRVDRYVDCPFKYFAENVLGLPEEREEATGLSPLERGRLVHEVFEEFYRQWEAGGHGTITAAALPEALALFERIAEAALAPLPDADRILERTRWFGSVVAHGVAEHVFEVEADAGGDVVRRLLVFDLKGPFAFPLLGGLTTRDIEIHGKADRIDVFRDGALRVVDYKLSKVPDMKATIQIAVYAHAAQQALQRADGQAHPIREARYVALGDDEDGSLAGKASIEAAVVARAEGFAGAVAAIERGEFPARPRRLGDCAWCRFAGVCRKEYREEADEAAESV
jgi:hypothetical protein